MQTVGGFGFSDRLLSIKRAPTKVEASINLNANNKQHCQNYTIRHARVMSSPYQHEMISFIEELEMCLVDKL